MGNGTRGREDILHHEAPGFRHRDKVVTRAVLCCHEGAASEDDPASSSLDRLLLAGSGGADLPLLACPQVSVAGLA